MQESRRILYNPDGDIYRIEVGSNDIRVYDVLDNFNVVPPIFTAEKGTPIAEILDRCDTLRKREEIS